MGKLERDNDRLLLFTNYYDSSSMTNQLIKLKELLVSVFGRERGLIIEDGIKYHPK